MDADKILQRAFAEMGREMPRRAIATRGNSSKREVRRVRSYGIWLAAAATVAVGVFLTLNRPVPTPAPAEPDFVCWVGVRKIENRDEAMEIAKKTLAEVDERVAGELAHINEILNLKK